MRLIALLREGCCAHGLELMDSSTAIQPLVVGDSQRAVDISQRLEARGYWISAIRPPTVPQGSARLRITLNAHHQRADIDRLLTTLSAALQAHP